MILWQYSNNFWGGFPPFFHPFEKDTLQTLGKFTALWGRNFALRFAYIHGISLSENEHYVEAWFDIKTQTLVLKGGSDFFKICHDGYFYIICISVFFWQAVVIFDRTLIFSFQRVLPVDKLACLTERMVSLCHLYHKANNNISLLRHSQLRLSKKQTLALRGQLYNDHLC